MKEIEELIGLLVAVVLLAWGARALGIPYPIVLVLGGLVVALVPGLPHVELDPEVVFLVFLPPLVHSAAYSTTVRRLRQHAGPISLLAIGLVGVTIAAVAVVAHALVDGLPWGAAAALGAIVAPTDAVAASSVFRRIGAPDRVVEIVEGESLFNDATGLVAYRIAIAAVVTGSFSWVEGLGDLVLVSLGGAAVGAIGAWLAGQLRRRLDDSLIEITITLLTPYATYVTAEELHVSGILAAVVSGVILGAQAHRLFSPGTRLESYAFWSVFTFLLESALFILVGLQVPHLLNSLPGSPGELALDAVGVVAVVIVLRMIAALSLRGLPRAERIVVGWSGMRGAVSLAAALSVPLTIDAGGDFPGRDVVIFLTLVVIGVTLVGQGLTLPLLVRRLLPPDVAEPNARAAAMARFQTVSDALERVSELSGDTEVAAPLIERARELYTTRASQLAGECRLGVAEADSDTASWLRLRLELLSAERRSLLDQRDRGEVSSGVAGSVERDLDLEEERIRARLASGEPAPA